jgi:monoamine oxidase
LVYFVANSIKIMKQDVIIVGAGLAGLSAAVHLHRQGRKVLLEATDRPGGRIKPIYEGYLLTEDFKCY